MSPNYRLDAEPIGIEFFDVTSSRTMRLVLTGAWQNWLVYKKPDGRWVSLRQCNHDDAITISAAVAKGVKPQDGYSDFAVGLLEVYKV